MAAAELIGDLAVLYTELAARRRPYSSWARQRPTTRERFQEWFTYGEHRFHS